MGEVIRPLERMLKRRWPNAEVAHFRGSVAFCQALVKQGATAEQLDRIYRRSGLMRPVWDEQQRIEGQSGTFGQFVISCALNPSTPDMMAE